MNFNPATDPIPHGLVVEASAGTGKTYSVAAIITRELALRDDLRIGQILITTFTRNAAAELRDRIRRRLVETVRVLRGEAPAGDDAVAARLRVGEEHAVRARCGRLERALVEFDSATISTIHGVCSRVLRAAGIDMGGVTDTTDTDRIVAEVVNDLVVAHATDAHRWDERRIVPLVMALLGDPFLEPWFDRHDAQGNDLPLAHVERLESLGILLRECVTRVHAALAARPSFNDLLRLAREVVCDDTRPELLAALRERFKLAIVDEAQDTDRQQWVLLTRLFPGGDGRALVSVGDPKQAIYGFRGADVRAYVEYATQASLHQTLTTNRRSDQPLLDALNVAFAEKTFGVGIAYITVDAPSHRQASQLLGMRAVPPSGPVEFIELGLQTSQTALARPVLGTVIELLDTARLATPQDAARPERPVEPKDICVLVRSGAVGRLVERELVRAGIPAVTGGTSSVMTSQMALDVRALLEAIEQPANLGRVRRAAATVFLGGSLVDAGVLAEEVILEVQDSLMTLSGVLEKQGIAALGATLEAREEIMARVAAGRAGERNLTDFLHVIEVLDASGPGRGCTAEQALAVFSRLAAMDDQHDLVSRRVESDADAVRILTIHKAKGLQFPCVIVADLWKPAAGRRGGGGTPAVFYDEDGTRKLDLGFAVERESARGKRLRETADDEESRRLLYVAATRAEHYLGLLVARGKPGSDGGQPRPSILEDVMRLPPPELMTPPRGRLTLTRRLSAAADADAELVLAPAPVVSRTFRRTSFSGITAIRGHGRRESPFEPEGGGYDEPAADGGVDLAALPAAAAESREVLDLPAGVAVGSVVHEIFEHIDTTQRPLADEVRRVVVARATSGRLRYCHDALVRIITDTLETPLGGPFGAVRLAEIPPSDRLAELEFEMGLAALGDAVKASAIGAVLREFTGPTDPLHGYAATLAGPAFDVPVGGLLTGSIDAVVRLPQSVPARPRLLLVDYKSNKLHRTGMADPLRAYHPDRLVAAMAEHHYPLQALLYGTAVCRMLRWRLPEADPDDCIAGVAYAFMRGMKGIDTPADEAGRRYGVFTWQPPRGLWARLSDLLAPAAVVGGAR
jgi:exodeoxyribonuclease V beta subunit